MTNPYGLTQTSNFFLGSRKVNGILWKLDKFVFNESPGSRKLAKKVEHTHGSSESTTYHLSKNFFGNSIHVSTAMSWFLKLRYTHCIPHRKWGFTFLFPVDSHDTIHAHFPVPIFSIWLYYVRSLYDHLYQEYIKAVHRLARYSSTTLLHNILFSLESNS